MKGYMELLVAAAILALTTAVATDALALPYAMTSSPYATVVLVIAALGAFSASPSVGLSLFLLTAVLFFKRNVHATMSSVYGESSIRTQPHAPAAPYEFQASNPRNYEEFAETAPSNPMVGPLKEGFEPAAYGDEAGAPVEGQFPKEKERPEGEPKPTDYVYRPAADMGSNEFERYGPDMDEKITSFEYTA